MYNATTIKANLIGLIGWRQNLHSTGMQLLGLDTSESGLWFNDCHSLLTFDNLVSHSAEFTRYVIASWGNAVPYVAGDYVAESSKTYICILGHTNEAVTNSTYWRETNLFTEWVRQKTEAAIIETIQDWITQKTNFKTARNLLERNTLFESIGNLTNELQVKTSKTVGIEIVPRKSKSLKIKISAISVQLDTNQDLTIRLKESGSLLDFKTQTVSYTANGAVQWFTVNWELDGLKSYWICYDEDTLTGQSVNGVKEFGFHTQGVDRFPTGRYYKAVSFRNDATLSSSAMFDLSKNEYLLETNFGLNFKLSSQCDYTDLIVEQKDLFKTAIYKKVGINLLNLFAFNPNARINRNETNADFNNIQFALNGDTQGKNQGLLHEYNEALKVISFDTAGIDRVCLPCKKTGVSIGSVYK